MIYFISAAFDVVAAILSGLLWLLLLVLVVAAVFAAWLVLLCLLGLHLLVGGDTLVG